MTLVGFGRRGLTLFDFVSVSNCGKNSALKSLIEGPWSNEAIGKLTSSLLSTVFLSSIAIRESIPSDVNGWSIFILSTAIFSTLAISAVKYPCNIISRLS